MTVALLVLVSIGCLVWAYIEHRLRVRVQADLHACVRVLERAMALAQAAQQTAHLNPLILSQAQRMQDAQDETDASRASGGRAR